MQWFQLINFDKVVFFYFVAIDVWCNAVIQNAFVIFLFSSSICFDWIQWSFRWCDACVNAMNIFFFFGSKWTFICSSILFHYFLDGWWFFILLESECGIDCLHCNFMSISKNENERKMRHSLWGGLQ